MILLGAKDANPWVELFESNMNFTFDVDRNTHDSVVTNKHPQFHESAKYYRHPNDSTQTAYALAAFLPGLNRNGDVLITTMVGTQAAADFIFKPGRLDTVIPLRGRKLPHFELLLQTASVGGSAQESNVIAYRIYP